MTISCQNISSSVFFYVGSLLQSFPEIVQKLPDELDDDFKKRDLEFRKAMALASNIPIGDSKEAEYDRLETQLLPHVREAAANFGARLLTDRVEITLDLGNFLFDLYMLSLPSPANAPLAQAIYQRKLQELSSRLEGETITILPNELALMKLGIESEALWSNIKTSAHFDLNGETKYFTLNDRGTSMFSPVVNAAIDLVLNNEAAI